ncbi:glycosyltransferase [Winogradskyella forsetii]|uniref:glycosyltransferase n=1 Tax=Winogradskyella forsetii TaxID=2686077 RepID=UPI0015B9BC8C|nr:glycosyltransferase [Winogradskyella forsetii]
MKTVLIIYPDWHPSNVAGVQRPRLIGNFTKEFGWAPKVITVEERFYSVKPDYDFEKTFSDDFDVVRVKAFSQNKIIGDIGLRAFFQMYKKAKEIIANESIQFIWFPIPTFYTSLLGRLLYEKTKIPYGIDYIDPWVRDITNQKGLRAKMSQSLAKLLEPIAIKKVAVISGVSTPYYEPVIRRNFPEFYNDNGELMPKTINRHTNKEMAHVGMPYGFDPKDHDIILTDITLPWAERSSKEKIWLYAGAFLPNSHELLSAFFEAISNLRRKGQWDTEIRLWFVGTGSYNAKSILSYAEDFGLEDIVFERRDRYPYLQVLNFLGLSHTIMVIGSTEKHYTASKTFQALLSNRPVVGVFHYESSAVKIMKESCADKFIVRYNPLNSKEDLISDFENIILNRGEDQLWDPSLDLLNNYSAKESARQLIDAIETIL